MIPNEIEWQRVYLYTCRIIASQFPVPAVSVAGLFFRAYLDWLVEQAGCRLKIFHNQHHRAVVASSASPDFTLWMHPDRYKLLTVDPPGQQQYGLLRLIRGGGSQSLRLCIAAYERARPQELWTTAVGWTNIQAALGLTHSLELHSFIVGPGGRGGERTVTAAEATVSVLWSRDIADLSPDQLAAVVANYFSVPRYFLYSGQATVDVKACVSFDCLAVYNCPAAHLYIRVQRTGVQEDSAKHGGFLVDKEVTRLTQNVVKNTALPGWPLYRPSHSATIFNEMVEIIQRCSIQV
jgi:hypothetical protein